MIIWSILILFVSLIIWDYLRCDPKKMKASKLFNGPLALPFLGNLYMYMNKKPEGEKSFQLSSWQCAKALRGVK